MAGLADVLRKALDPLAKKIEMAFVYGSQTDGTARGSSDIDLMVIGQVDAVDLHWAIAKAEEKLVRTVNYALMDRKEFERRRSEKGGFLERVLNGEKIFIIIGNPENV
jgi:predicted nucleotidyltransferase